VLVYTFTVSQIDEGEVNDFDNDDFSSFLDTKNDIQLELGLLQMQFYRILK